VMSLSIHTLEELHQSEKPAFSVMLLK
jgi:hypothetical protein